MARSTVGAAAWLPHSKRHDLRMMRGQDNHPACDGTADGRQPSSLPYRQPGSGICWRWRLVNVHAPG
jgi:hypothetical protein